MKLRKFGGESTKINWETRKAVWHCWARGANINATQVFFRENTHAYEDAPFDGDVIRQVRGELYKMPLNLAIKLVSELPAIRSFVVSLRPDLMKDLDALPVTEGAQIEPIVVRNPMTEAERRKHNNQLLGIITKLGKGISEITTSDGLTGHEAIIKNDWHNSQGYNNEFWWTMNETKVNTIHFHVESDEQFQYLAQHLQDTKFWDAFQHWKQVIRKCLDVWYRWYQGDESDYSQLKKIKQMEEDEGKILLGAYQEVHQYFSVPGQCDLCRS
jgi:hypothetical protein